MPVIVVALSSSVLLAVLRRAAHRTPREDEQQQYSVGLLAIAAAGLLQSDWAGESVLDPAASPLLGENISDLLRSLYICAAAALIGLPALRTILISWPGEEVPDYRRWWLLSITIAATTLIITSRVGSASTVPVRDELELRDLASGIYSGTFYLVALALCIVMATASALTIRRVGWRLIPAATGLVGVIGGISSIVTLALLIVDRAWLADNHFAITTGWALPLSAVLAGAGALGVIRRLVARHG